MNNKPIEKQIYDIDCWSENFVSFAELLVHHSEVERLETERIKKFLEATSKIFENKRKRHGYIPK